MSQANQVFDWMDSHQDEMIGFLQNIVDTPSVNNFFAETEEERRSPAYHEKRCQAVVASKLESLGCAVDQWEPDQARLAKYHNRAGYHPERDYTDRPTLCGVLKGTGGGKSLMLLGHIDVVMGGSGWSKDPFHSVVEDGKIYGRGVVDQKGGIAAMIMALEAIRRSGIRLKGDVLVSTFCDEEAGGMGIMSLMDRGYRADAAIMTEPTDLLIAPMCRGILWGKMTVTGRAGHIEMYQGDFREGGAVDAIEKAQLFLDHFKRLNAEWAVTKTHPLLRNPCQILIAQFNAGEYPTSYANKAEIVFNAQYRPQDRDENLLGGDAKNVILELVSNVAKTDSWCKDHVPQIEWLMDADCAETPADHPFVQCFRAASEEAGCQSEIGGLGFHTDMGWPTNSGIPTINYGPGKPEVSHRSDEALAVEDYLRASKVIAQAILNWCGIGE